ncbi:MAG: hypothetical protein RSA29_02645 [Clostridium sp.]|uniref:hypothetical protein n=1 Tax=Clostridium sp. TaxID=1506 RepID=UPI00305CA00D
MKKVRMKISIASADWSYYPGLEVILGDEVAEVWDKVGHCEIIEDMNRIEEDEQLEAENNIVDAEEKEDESKENSNEKESQLPSDEKVKIEDKKEKRGGKSGSKSK